MKVERENPRSPTNRKEGCLALKVNISSEVPARESGRTSRNGKGHAKRANQNGGVHIARSGLPRWTGSVVLVEPRQPPDPLLHA